MDRNLKLIYDGNCRFCKLSAHTLLRLTLVEGHEVIQFAQADDETTQQIDFEKFRNELALVQNNNTLYGAEALVHLIGDQYPILEKILSYDIIDDIFDFGYKTISHNRYMILPPKPSAIQCDCEPTFNWLYSLSFAAFFGFIGVQGWSFIEQFFNNNSGLRLLDGIPLVSSFGVFLILTTVLVYAQKSLTQAMKWMNHLIFIFALGGATLWLFSKIIIALDQFLPILSTLSISAGMVVIVILSFLSYQKRIKHLEFPPYYIVLPLVVAALQILF